MRDAALVDGCDEPQALLVALGHDVIEPTTFEALGWYKLRDQAAINAYCDDWEAREDRSELRAPAKPPESRRAKKGTKR